MAHFKKNRARQPRPQSPKSMTVSKPMTVPKPMTVSKRRRVPKPTKVSKPAAVSEPTAASSFCSLPPELFDRILSKVTSRDDLSSLSRCSHGLYWAVSDFLYTKALGKEIPHKGVCDDECGVECDDAIASVFVHAVRHDSVNLIQWLIFREHGPRLRG